MDSAQFIIIGFDTDLASQGVVRYVNRICHFISQGRKGETLIYYNEVASEYLQYWDY